MIERTDFAEGLTFLAIALRQRFEPADLEVYYEVIKDETDALAWKAFVREAAASGRWQFLPRAGEILQALHEPAPTPMLPPGEDDFGHTEKPRVSPEATREYFMTLPRSTLDYRVKCQNLTQKQYDEITRLRRARMSA